MLRYLRMAGAIGCGTVAVLLIALWARSYWWQDHVQGPLVACDGFSVTSVRGRLMASVWWKWGSDGLPITRWDYDSISTSSPRSAAGLIGGPMLVFAVADPEGPYLHVPHWVIAVMFGLATVVLARGRFGVRTLIIVTAVLGATLALASYCNSGPGIRSPMNPDINRPITNETFVGQPWRWRPVG